MSVLFLFLVYFLFRGPILYAWLVCNSERSVLIFDVFLVSLAYAVWLVCLLFVLDSQVALSVMMTTITTLGAIVMTPLLCKLLLGTVVPVDAVGIALSTIQVRRMYVCDSPGVSLHI